MQGMFTMELIGVDVGFSATRATTGVAVLVGDQVSLGRSTSEAAARHRFLTQRVNCRSGSDRRATVTNTRLASAIVRAFVCPGFLPAPL
jgi:hypothetical protein